MNLHVYPTFFQELIDNTARFFNIDIVFVEKDYWVTLALQRMSQNPNAEKVVFKGGTSLSKAYRLTSRFSEDIDIAVIDAESFSGNQLKMLIKRLAKNMAEGLEENVISGITSKGSRFYKAIYLYPQLANPTFSPVNTGQLLIEINTYANPYPYQKQQITSFISDYLMTLNRQDLIEEHNLLPFSVNVLYKSRTMLEKLVSLLRFSFAKNPKSELTKKIRHFYDLYYLANDEECTKYIQSVDFQKDLQELFAHDQQEFDEPTGWQTKTIENSPLISDFPDLWNTLRETYSSELPKLAFIPIPNEKEIEKIFTIIKRTIK